MLVETHLVGKFSLQRKMTKHKVLVTHCQKLLEKITNCILIQLFTPLNTKGHNSINTSNCSMYSVPHRTHFYYFFYCCSSTVVSIFPPQHTPAPPIPNSHPRSCPPLALSMGPSYVFLDGPSPFPLVILFCSPLVTVCLFFISMSLVLFCLLVFWFIRFYLKVRSYGICLSPPGLFHLA